MRKNVGREIALLTLPILMIGGVGLYMRPKPARVSPLKVVLVKKWVANSAGVNDFNINMILQWNRSWLDKRISIPFQSQGRVLNADGKVVAKQSGYGFGREEGTKNQYYYVFTLNPIGPSSTPWKKPLTFQSSLIVDNYPPLQVNVELPPDNQQDSPRQSKFAFPKSF